MDNGQNLSSNLEGEISRRNREGWSRKAYEAWVNGNGSAEQLAAKLQQNPGRKLQTFDPYLGDVQGKRIANLLGSNGKMAVSLALNGAAVQVVDISPENARYALELAQAAGVTIKYTVADVMQIPEAERPTDCDIVLMELGILHWIMDIGRFFQLVHRMLRVGGCVIIRDFHPVKRGLLRWENGLMVASGDYFDNDVHEGKAPYAIHLTEEEQQALTGTFTRGWTMGQIVTAMAEAGLMIRALREESGPGQRWMFPPDAPAGIEDRIPGIFTVVADRIT